MNKTNFEKIAEEIIKEYSITDTHSDVKQQFGTRRIKTALKQAYQQGRDYERERCAKTAERCDTYNMSEYHDGCCGIGIANEIRSNK